MDGSIGKQFLKEYIQKTDPLITKYLEGRIQEASEIGAVPKETMVRFLDLIRKGKKIRGALVVLGYQAAGGTDLEEIYDTSLFMEIVHAGALIHDDIMDNDALRRGEPSFHKQFEALAKERVIHTTPRHYGISIAIPTSDVSFYLSCDKLITGKFPQDNVVKAMNIYIHYLIRLGLGQILEFANSGMENLNEEEVLKALWIKSGEYTSLLPLHVGATLAGLKDKKKLEAINEYARCFGWAFQIQDDYLGLFGDEEEIGKPVGSDIREGKQTLFITHMAKHGTSQQKESMRKYLGNKKIDEKDVKEFLRNLEQAGSKKYVVDLGWKYVEEGKPYVAQITSDKAIQGVLESLLVFMMERTN